MTPSAMRGVLNDAISIYFADATLASAFVARWCAPCQRSRRPGACSACAMMSRRRGSGRGCIGPRDCSLAGKQQRLAAHFASPATYGRS
jgi:hypothetical protein